MICPHCRQRLLRRERTDRRCTRCRRRFALEPKLDQGLTDLRLRQHADRLTDGGRLVCTTDQLRWSVVTRQLPRAERARPPEAPPEPTADADRPGCATAGAVVPLAAAVLWAVLVPGHRLLALAPAALGLWFLFGLLVIVQERRKLPRLRREWQRSHDRWTEQLRTWQDEQRRWTDPLLTPVNWTARRFRDSVLASWTSTYGALPTGVVDDAAVVPVRPAGTPALAVLCPDPTVTAFLHANDFPGRHRALLVGRPEEIPAGVPVVVLHDASPQGCLLVADTRAALPGRRVVDAGLSARTALAGGERTVQLYERRLREPLAEQLARLPGLTREELAWYTAGLWSPIAAQPPKRVLAAAEQAAERAVAKTFDKRPGPADEPADARASASDLGFLSWPDRPTDPDTATPEVPR
ncbi:hypothetical protein PUR61_03960 [Streptomyces sp. BE20]|uniref:hypothetical protein n=1 Tax=Streptomyces sp. BE20 TaxID=3002525 RepID=UPI002E76B6CD|nr:hypothetical protein [Streptomyces sp. BE20]MEE1821355.1 hypothetical protein [Streptomyces sp. BE20]